MNTRCFYVLSWRNRWLCIPQICVLFTSYLRNVIFQRDDSLSRRMLEVWWLMFQEFPPVFVLCERHWLSSFPSWASPRPARRGMSCVSFCFLFLCHSQHAGHASFLSVILKWNFKYNIQRIDFHHGCHPPMSLSFAFIQALPPCPLLWPSVLPSGSLYLPG